MFLVVKVSRPHTFKFKSNLQNNGENFDKILSGVS